MTITHTHCFRSAQYFMKIMRIRKAVSITEYPAIGKISVRGRGSVHILGWAGLYLIYEVGLDSEEMDCLFRRQVSTFMS